MMDATTFGSCEDEIKHAIASKQEKEREEKNIFFRSLSYFSSLHKLR